LRPKAALGRQGSRKAAARLDSRLRGNDKGKKEASR